VDQSGVALSLRLWPTSWTRGDGVALSLVGDAIFNWQSQRGVRKARSAQLAGAGGGAPGAANMAFLRAEGSLASPTLDASPDKDAAHSRLQPGLMSDTQSDRVQAPKTAWRAAGPCAGDAAT